MSEPHALITPVILFDLIYGSTQGGPGAVIERIAALTGTRATRAGKGWTLDAIDGAPR